MQEFFQDEFGCENENRNGNRFLFGNEIRFCNWNRKLKGFGKNFFLTLVC
jgi:hypothetical protein